MNRQLYFISLCFLISFSNSFAAATVMPSRFFQQSFQLIRDDHQRLVEVRIRKKSTPNLNEEIQKVLDYQKRFPGKSVDPIIDQLAASEETQGFQGWSNLRKTFWNDLIHFPLEEIVHRQDFHRAIIELQKIILKNYSGADIIARPREPGFFINYKVKKAVFDMARKMVVSQLADSTGAGVAMYFFEKALDQIEARRTYYQNMFLQLIETEPAFEVQSEEAQVVMSSIMESRLAWYNLPGWESAKKDWARFGFNEMKQEKEKALARWSRNHDGFDESKMINFGFSQSIQGEQVWIHNQLDKKGAFSGAPSVSYNSARPRAVLEERQLYDFVDFGLAVLPAVSLVSPMAKYVLKKLYWDQIKSEGGLFMFLIQQSQLDLAGQIVHQSLNPFLIREL